jgi:hypothetical protein
MTPKMSQGSKTFAAAIDKQGNADKLKYIYKKEKSTGLPSKYQILHATDNSNIAKRLHDNEEK